MMFSGFDCDLVWEMTLWTTILGKVNNVRHEDDRLHFAAAALLLLAGCIWRRYTTLAVLIEAPRINLILLSDSK